MLSVNEGEDVTNLLEASGCSVRASQASAIDIEYSPSGRTIIARRLNGGGDALFIVQGSSCPACVGAAIIDGDQLDARQITPAQLEKDHHSPAG